jgi:hypothetical protein
MFLLSLTKSKEVLTRASISLSVATHIVANEYEEARHNITRLRVGHFRLEEEVGLRDALECNWCGLNKTKCTVEGMVLCLRQKGIFYTYITFGRLVVLVIKLLVSITLKCLAC